MIAWESGIQKFTKTIQIGAKNNTVSTKCDVFLSKLKPTQQVVDYLHFIKEKKILSHTFINIKSQNNLISNVLTKHPNGRTAELLSNENLLGYYQNQYTTVKGILMRKQDIIAIPDNIENLQTNFAYLTKN